MKSVTPWAPALSVRGSFSPAKLIFAMPVKPVGTIYLRVSQYWPESGEFGLRGSNPDPQLP